MNPTRKGRRTAGFTLIELIVVLVILGILAALAIPTFNAIRQRGTQTVATADATTVARYASNIWGLYQGKNGDGTDPGDVSCGTGTQECFPADMVANAAKESGFTEDNGVYTKGNTKIEAGTNANTWQLVSEAGTSNVSYACITYADQLFTVESAQC